MDSSRRALPRPAHSTTGPEGTPTQESAAPWARSSVTLWSGPRGRRMWSIRVVDGTTAQELAEIVGMALDAAERLRTGAEGGAP
jgi:hypothetical protein